jgi:hypothetical protein
VKKKKPQPFLRAFDLNTPEALEDFRQAAAASTALPKLL